MADRVVVFVLAERFLALPLSAVRECLPLPALAVRPDTPPALAGFAVLSGRSVPVIDLAVLLGLRSPGAAPFGEAGGVYRHLLSLPDAALLVDRVLTVGTAGPGPAEADADGWQHGCIAARITVDGTAVALLAPDRLLAEAEQRRLDELRSAEQRREALWNADAVRG